MSTLSIVELRKLSEEVARARHDQLRAGLAELLATIESGPVTLEDAAERLRAILEGGGSGPRATAGT